MKKGKPDGEIIHLRLWGSLACFSSRASKPNRHTYPILTPTAALEVLKAVYWNKHEIGDNYRICQIHVIAPIQYHNIVLNESPNRGANPKKGDYRRKQTRVTALKDPEYVVSFSFDMDDPAKNIKHTEMFKRWVSDGKYRRMPYFGLSDYPAYFEIVDEIPQSRLSKYDLNKDIGELPLKSNWKDGRRWQRFFHAKLENGILNLNR